MKNLLFLFAFIMTCSACNKVYIQEAYLLEESQRRPLPDNMVDVKTFYGGDAYQYITFQVEIENKTRDTIEISDSDISIKLDKDYRRQVQFYPIPKEDILYNLETTAVQIERERKAQRTGNIIASGANIIGGILLGAGAVESIVFGVNDATIIAEDDRRGKLAKNSIEDQIIYHEEYTLDHGIILPGGFASFDVHFERPMTDGRCEIEVDCADATYRFDYMLEVVKVKR